MENKKSKLCIARKAVGGVVFVLFLLLLIDPGAVCAKALHPLACLQFWPAVMAVDVGALVLLVALTMLLGRAYCSILCPLGILQDIVFQLKTAGKKSRRFRGEYLCPQDFWRRAILLVFVILHIFGATRIANFVEPYSIFGRMVTSTLGKSLPIAAISLLTLGIIVFLVLKWGRVWCNVICPVGTTLGILSRKSLFKVQINEESCVSCGLCGKACRANCIDTKNHAIDYSRCVLCFDCLDNCHSGAIKYEWTLVRPKTSEATDGAQNASNDVAQNEPDAAQNAPDAAQNNETPAPTEASAVSPDNSRRTFLLSSALALGTAATAAAADHSHGFLGTLVPRKTPDRKVPVLPPGARSIRLFTQHCVACQLCVSACPNDVLRPSTDMARFMQPEMGFEKGFCRPECNTCSTVCPADAIKPVSVEEKSSISIGRAVLNLDDCVVLKDGVKCGNCARHCPAGAISMVKSDSVSAGLRIPSVNPARCIGCGRCEYVCPSRPVSAIHVEGNEVHHFV